MSDKLSDAIIQLAIAIHENTAAMKENRRAMCGAPEAATRADTDNKPILQLIDAADDFGPEPEPTTVMIEAYNGINALVETSGSLANAYDVFRSCWKLPMNAPSMKSIQQLHSGKFYQRGAFRWTALMRESKLKHVARLTGVLTGEDK